MDTASPLAQSEPDNLDILHEACKLSPSQSQDTPTSVATNQQHHHNSGFDSPHHWHTNHLAESHDHDSRPLNSRCSDHNQSVSAVSRSRPFDNSCSDHRKSASVSSSVSSSSHADTHHSMSVSSARENCKQQTDQAHGDSALHQRASSDDEQSENVAPAWHEQHQQHSNSSNKSAVVSTASKERYAGVHSQSKAVDFGISGLINADKDHIAGLDSHSKATEFGGGSLIGTGKDHINTSQTTAAEFCSDGLNGAGRNSLVEGYIEGVNAKLQLPAAVRTRSRNSALHARTPLRSITEVSSEP